MLTRLRRPMTRRLAAGWVALCLLLAPLLANVARAWPAQPDAFTLAVMGSFCTATPDGTGPASPLAPEHRAPCIDLCTISCLGAAAPAPAVAVFVPAAPLRTVGIAVRPGVDSAPSISLPYTRGPPFTS